MTADRGDRIGEDALLLSAPSDAEAVAVGTRATGEERNATVGARRVELSYEPRHQR